MSLTNDFVQFATAGGANVESQATYLADTNRTNGNQPGVASSALNNKALRQGTYVASNLAQAMSDITGTSILDDTNTAEFLAQLKATIQRLAPVITEYTSGSGTHNLSYYFFCASANATTGATYTNNTVTFTVVNTISGATLLLASGSGAPTASGTLTKASGTGDATITFYAVRSPISLEVEMVAGGGGGGGAAGSPTNGGNGGDTTFDTLTAKQGGGGATAGTGGDGVAGSTVGSGWTGIALTGTSGSSATTNSSGTRGGEGGSSFYGGGGRAGFANGGGTVAVTNSGSGGGGGVNSGTSGGGGGASGGFVRAYNTAPTGSYAYSVGTGGTAGAGTDNGGAGAAGRIQVIQRYQ